MDLKIFPWQRGEAPFGIDEETGLEWYIDKSTTNYCARETINELPKLNAVCFFVVENKDGNRNALTRILIDKKTKQILAEYTSLEQMCCKIDILRLAKKF